jgi:phosphatidylinositol alpha-1,6-mannosyltransferase
MGHLYLAPIGWLLGILLGKPYGVMLHGGELHRYYHWLPVRRIMTAALNRAAFLTVNTAFTQRQYVEQRGVRPTQRFVRIYPGVDGAIFRPDVDGSRWRERFDLQDRRVLLTVARLVEWKGHASVLEALAAVLDAVPNVHYVIAGTGPFRPELERLVNELGLQKHVTFAGFVADEELPALYCAADLFVQASLSAASGTEIEGFGITFVEASACGLPVIGGRTGGTGEAIAEGVTGLRVDSGDTEALAQAIIRLLTDHSLSQQFGSAGRARAVREFDWAIQTAKLRAFLEEELPRAQIVTSKMSVS